MSLFVKFNFLELLTQLKSSSAKQTSETNMKNAKKNYLQEIKQANAVIKSLEKAGKG